MLRSLVFAALFLGLLPASVLGAEDRPLVLAPDGDGVQRATLRLGNYSYSPKHLVVQAGRPIELTLINTTTLTPHNFIIRDPATGLAVEQDVRPGKTVALRFTSPRPGVLIFFCDKRLLFFKSHRERGMEGRLEIR